MSSRAGFPKAKLSRSHYFLTLARGENMRCFALRPWALYAAAGIFPLCGVLYFSASLVYIMRDDVVTGMYQRQRAMQQAYEDKLAEMRSQVDRVSSKQLLNQNSLEGKLHRLISRQAMLETRSAVIARLTNSVTGPNESRRQRTASAPIPPRRPASTAKNSSAGLLPAGATSYSQTNVLTSPASIALGNALGGSASNPLAGRPKPRAIEVVPDNSANKNGRKDKLTRLKDPYVHAVATDSRLPVAMRINALSLSLDKVEADQLNKVAIIGSVARQKARKLRKVIATTGLSAKSLRLPGNKGGKTAAGGPFVPYRAAANSSAFEKAVLNLQEHLKEASRLQRLLRYIPVVRPLPAKAALTSGYGRRIDPFNGRAANHTGIDFRERYGAPVFSTAAGRVVQASRHGGYGKMVEIDHGNGLITRYAHLSAYSVSKGQWVKRGAKIGKIGSTGRSTGAHLHYEVRLNDKPLNPMRFLRAGRKL